MSQVVDASDETFTLFRVTVLSGNGIKRSFEIDAIHQENAVEMATRYWQQEFPDCPIVKIVVRFSYSHSSDRGTDWEEYFSALENSTM